MNDGLFERRLNIGNKIKISIYHQFIYTLAHNCIKYFPVKLLSQGQMTIIQDSDESLLLLAFHLVVSDFNVFL